MSRRFRLSRRAFLGGAGATLALPLLEAMLPSALVPRAHASEVIPRRHLYFYVPNGIHMPNWTPQAAGTAFELPPILAPLADFRDDLLVVTNLANRPGQPDGPGDHAAGTGSFLTCTHVRKTAGEDIVNGISVDQVAAGAIGSATRFPSLQFGSQGGAGVGSCDSGYSCAYTRNISWAGPQTPLPKMVNPQLVFDRFFSGFDPEATAEQVALRRQQRLSVLDYVLDDAHRLQTRLGADDQHKLDEYMSGVRQLELQIADEDARVCDPIAYPPRDADVQTNIRLMCDLMVLAFQCDLTRVATYMLGNAGSNRGYGWLGVIGGHHDLSHHQNSPLNHAALTTIATWEIEQLAYLLGRLAQAHEPDGSRLLDHTMVFFSSEISDGNRHNHDNLPVLLAGQCGGRITTGRHVVLSQERPIADLFIGLLDTLDVHVDTFGDDGTEPLGELFA